ncbi:MAG TPA: 2-oxo acid dehydrogenase subunit E2 [Candidatus Dormibacteraeota bacterium]|nr:2-oxo acid dehydrogenase subunit E2 [Candidatus Dormibacteraeota bacterium]
MGRIAERVVAMEGSAVVRPTMLMSLSCDHRRVDGARAAEFVQTLVGLIEKPA